MGYRILLVDNDPDNLSLNKKVLSKAGYVVVTADSGEIAIELVRKARSDFAAILMDHHMEPGISGPVATAEIKKIVPSQQILSFSIDNSIDVVRDGFKSGASDYLYKNVDNETLLQEVAKACAKYDQFCRSIRLGNVDQDEKSEFISETHMVGKSDATYELCKQVRKVARADTTVLILGETGAGKEIVANAIHKCSERRNGPLVAINIAAESASLLDSTLFGHRKGSFTGATNDQLGKFQLADKGTIFLDEIGDLALDLQVKLLRVIQEREINPIGALRSIPVNVRIIAATHQNLQKMVEAGTFREDLYYRLNTVILETKPLRERPDDIEPLVGFFTEQVCKENGFRRWFNHQCLDVLKRHTWKSNVRGLRSMVEKHLVMADSNEIMPSDLDRSLFETHSTQLPMTMDEIDSHVDTVKRDHLTRIILDSETYADAARTLRVAPNRLHYFLSKFGLGNLL